MQVVGCLFLEFSIGVATLFINKRFALNEMFQRNASSARVAIWLESLALVQVSVEITMFYIDILMRKIDLPSFFKSEKICKSKLECRM